MAFLGDFLVNSLCRKSKTITYMSDIKNQKKPEYKPLLDPQKKHKEATAYSVTIGLLMTIIFSAAAAYLGLKVGQVFEAAIPIAIIDRKSTRLNSSHILSPKPRLQRRSSRAAKATVAEPNCCLSAV